MIARIVLACVVAVAVGLLCVYILGPLLLTIAVPVAQIIGRFFVDWGWALGILAGLWYFFTGGPVAWPWRRA